MFNALFGRKERKEEKKGGDFEIEDDDDKEEENEKWMKSFRVNLSRMIVYAESADVMLQREVGIGIEGGLVILHFPCFPFRFLMSQSFPPHTVI